MNAHNAHAPASNPSTDVLVIGGGINGTGIARDLAGRGLSVVLCEQDDLAQHTSSASSKLIHGGLRYLEHREFALVRKALIERERLMRSAPHLISPLRFVMPHDAAMRPAWMIRLGLFLYDHLARRELLPASSSLDLTHSPFGEPLQTRFTRGFVYSDGWVDDARLVVLNAVDAAQRGATVHTRTRCTDAQRHATHWQATLQHAEGRTTTLQARALVNAAGPWAAQFLGQHAHQPHPRALRLVKGSHIVVPRVHPHDHAYLLQSPDGRIVFLLPFEQHFTLIGTTDVEHTGPIGEVQVDDAEVQYLCALANRYLRQPLSPADVAWRFAGVRPLLDDANGNPAAVTRDYRLELDTGEPSNRAPLLSVWGGKLTTFRKLAEEAGDHVCQALGHPGRAWTERALLPGGDLSAWIGAPQRPDTDLARFLQALRARHPQLPEALAERWSRAYGSRIEALLNDDDLGHEIAPGLFEAELHHLRDAEWARSADDVLWRRSKLGLHHTPAQREAVSAWWMENGTRR